MILDEQQLLALPQKYRFSKPGDAWILLLKCEPLHVLNHYQSFLDSGTLGVQKTVQNITIYTGRNSAKNAFSTFSNRMLLLHIKF